MFAQRSRRPALDEEAGNDSRLSDSSRAARGRRGRPNGSSGRAARRDERDEEDEEQDEDGQDEQSDGERESGEDAMDRADRDASNYAQLVKNLVRYALACDFSRTPIRRDGIRDKVLGSYGRLFKKVFAGAQQQLMVTFGMRMVELPARSQATMTAYQRRKAAKTQRDDTHPSLSSKAYVLTTTLRGPLCDPTVLTPANIQSPDAEASYIGLYTTIIALIVLSGGELSDARLQRHLRRLNADSSMPSGVALGPGDGVGVEKTDAVLQRMIKQGYILRVVEAVPVGGGDDETVFWHVGSRGKIEVGNEAIAGMVRCVYGRSTEALEKKLQISLRVEDGKGTAAQRVSDGAGPVDGEENEEDEAPAGEPGPSNSRSSRRRRGSDDEMEDDDG